MYTLTKNQLIINMKTTVKHNHLFKIKNDDEGKAFIQALKSLMKNSKSCHTIRVKGRSPKGGYKAYNGGSDGYVKLEQAEYLAVYIK